MYRIAMQYIWQTLCLANWNVMQIGRHLVWQIGLIEANSNLCITLYEHNLWYCFIIKYSST